LSFNFSWLSPQKSTNGVDVRTRIQDPCGASPESFRDVQLLRTWLEYDSDAGETGAGRLNWTAVLGLMLVVGISAGFWTGAVLIAQHIRK
jgi:hypothetical protein